jgi:23S rRNA pseudouridine1911/1915/1917 synthase
MKVEDTSQAPRVMLHAAELGFVHPESGEDLRFSSPLPADITKLLNWLRAGRDASRPGGSRSQTRRR